MEKTQKHRLLLYALCSALTFLYLILADGAGIGVPIFMGLQFLSFVFLRIRPKRLWIFIPLFVLSLNALIGGNMAWRLPNGMVCIFLYGLFLVRSDAGGPDFLLDILKSVFRPLRHLFLPFRWIRGSGRKGTVLFWRVLIAALLSVPAAVVLLILLSSADMVFSELTQRLLLRYADSFRIDALMKLIVSAAAGLYLFGVAYAALSPSEKKEGKRWWTGKTDTLILNIFLTVILSVYTCFVFIQFKYLFANGGLPYGLTYTEYARKGFFELLFLSCVNIGLILLAVYMTAGSDSGGARLSKWLSFYLCGVTCVLLVSSYYRMYLYNQDDGLTRLRFYVFGFLIFEAVGLLLTFYYILKPRFPILCVYLALGLVYYCLLNLVPVDRYVAKSQIDRYFEGKPAGISYTLTLSSDAADEIKRLIDAEGVEESVRAQALDYFVTQRDRYEQRHRSWQSYNLSGEHVRQIADRLAPRD